MELHVENGCPGLSLVCVFMYIWYSGEHYANTACKQHLAYSYIQTAELHG